MDLIDDIEKAISKKPKLELAGLILDPVNSADPHTPSSWTCTKCGINYGCPMIVWTISLTLVPPKDCVASPMQRSGVCTKCAEKLLVSCAEHHLEFYQLRKKECKQ